MKRLEIHYTPQTWQLAKYSGNRMGCLKSELAAWEHNRDTEDSKIKWHFKTRNARKKLISLCPVSEIETNFLQVEFSPTLDMQ